MRLKSHLLVAERTMDIIEYMTGIEFNRKFMKIGAVLPDIQPFRRIQLHSYSIVSEHYYNEFNRIVNKEKMINRISLILGLLSHYIADAFTLSHNIYVKNMKKHIQYEHLLDEVKTNIPIKFDELVSDVEKYIDEIRYKFDDITSYIRHVNDLYINKIKDLKWEQNIILDINEAIIHGATVLINFISELQKVHVPALVGV